MQFKRSGEFTKKKREKSFKEMFILMKALLLWLHLSNKKTKKAIFGGLALQFIYQISYQGKPKHKKNESFTQVMQKKQDRDFFVVYYPIFINSTLRVIQKLVFSKYHKTHNSLQKIDPSYIIISNPKGTHRRNHTHKKVLSIISRICRNKCIQCTHALYLMSKFFIVDQKQL